MKKNIQARKDANPPPNNCISTRTQNKKITHNMTTSSTTLSSKANPHQIAHKQIKSNNTNIQKNNNIINDHEFISYINKLSDIIKTLHKANNTNFTTMKNILENSSNNMKNNANNSKQNKNNNKFEKDNNHYYENLNTINNSFNHIESAFNNFYTNAIVLFKKMKTYKETVESKKALINLDDNKKDNELSLSNSPRKNLLEQNKSNYKQIITNLNTKNFSNDTLDNSNSVDNITKKVETETNETKKKSNFEINVNKKIKKVYNKTPSKALKSIDNSKRGNKDITKNNNTKETEFLSILNENNLLKEKNSQLEKKKQKFDGNN